MKVLHIYKTYYPESIGGIENFIETLSFSLKKNNIQSSLLTTTTTKKIRVEKTSTHDNVFYFPSNVTIASCPMSFSLLKQFKKITESFDILHYHLPWPFADFTHLLSRTNKPTIVTYHSDVIKQKVLNQFYLPVMHQFLKRVNTIVATSPNYVKTSPILQQYSDKTIAIPFGMVRSQLPIPSDSVLHYWKNRVGENFFFFVGVLRYYKGLSFLLEAVANTNIPVVIAGTGPEEKILEKIVAERKLRNVIFVGQIDQEVKSALYELCRAVVAPSHLRSEAFCLTLLEGLLFQKPLISTEIGTGTSFVNQHDFSGIVVPPENPNALREAMQRLLLDENYYQRLKANTQRHYEDHFTIDVMTDKYSELYRSLMIQRG